VRSGEGSSRSRIGELGHIKPYRGFESHPLRSVSFVCKGLWEILDSVVHLSVQAAAHLDAGLVVSPLEHRNEVAIQGEQQDEQNEPEGEEATEATPVSAAIGSYGAVSLNATKRCSAVLVASTLLAIVIAHRLNPRHRHGLHQARRPDIGLGAQRGPRNTSPRQGLSPRRRLRLMALPARECWQSPALS
jgi:hypothetical protein